MKTSKHLCLSSVHPALQIKLLQVDWLTCAGAKVLSKEQRLPSLVYLDLDAMHRGCK